MSGPRPAEGAFGALPALNTSELGRNLLLLSEVDSTNRYLKDNGGELPHGRLPGKGGAAGNGTYRPAGRWLSRYCLSPRCCPGRRGRRPCSPSSADWRRPVRWTS